MYVVMICDCIIHVSMVAQLFFSIPNVITNIKEKMHVMAVEIVGILSMFNIKFNKIQV